MILLTLIIFALCTNDRADAASMFRYFNPYYWLSPARQLPIVPIETVTPAKVEPLDPTTSPLISEILTTTMSPAAVGLAVIPSRVGMIGLSDGVSPHVIPTQISPITTDSMSVRRSGLMREPEEKAESREDEILIEETTTSRSIADTGTAQTSAELITNTPTAKTNQKTTESPLLPTTSALITTDEPLVLSNDKAVTAPASPVTSSETPTTTLVDTRPVRVPVYVFSGNQQPQIQFLYQEDFARYLNKHYYTDRGVFEPIVGMG